MSMELTRKEGRTRSSWCMSQVVAGILVGFAYYNTTTGRQYSNKHKRNAMRCDAIRCDAMPCHAMPCHAMPYDAMRFDAMG
ncbi:hypothetical protein M0804_005980 [Polistes exclamans]|nr:hypothetical protein M0804_005980 [Polistes exclamans]